MKFIHNLTSFAPFLAAATVGVCTVSSLSGYVAPVFTPVEVQAEEETEENKEVKETVHGNFELADGIYEGTGTGFAGKIKVAVEIKDKTIVAIEILDAGADDAAFVNRAKGVIDRIIASQSFDVDVVSGATYSSNGIIAAVKNALTGEVDNNQTAEVPTGKGSTTVSKVEEPSAYKDGTYYGSGTGFAGTMTVKVVISGGKITAITIQNTNDDSSYVQSASAVISRIIAGQTTNVDTVSGATYSSVGIIQAVRNALSQAAVNGTENTNTGNSNAEEEEQEEVAIVEGLVPYLDGTYYGTGEGYNAGITVAVVIEGKTIRSISIVEHNDDAAFMVRAEKILDRVVANQTAEVDVVTGATFSSEGILEAIKNALAEADKATNGEPEQKPEEEQPEKPDDSEEGSGGAIVTPGGDESSGSTYKDGEYAVTVVCEPDAFEEFDAYNLSAIVKIENNKIVAITNVSGDGEEDNDRYIGWAANGRGQTTGIVAQILTTGTLESVDAVSRATCTSNALVEICQKALEQAKTTEQPNTGENENGKLDDENAEVEQPDDESTEVEQPEESEDTNYIYQDGEYSATVVCNPDAFEEFYPYNLSLKITVQQDRIVSITNVVGDGDAENDRYIGWAANGRGSKAGVVTQILQAGTFDPAQIDTVTYATCSSKSILEACQIALQQAKIK